MKRTARPGTGRSPGGQPGHPKHEKLRLGKRGVETLLSDVMGIEIYTGSICNMKQVASEALAAPCDEAATHVPLQPIVNTDETGWFEGRRDGLAKRAWLWVATTATVTVFRIANSRASVDAREILGESLSSLLGTDRYGAYSWVRTDQRQLCWAHLIRDFQGFIDRKDAAAPVGKLLLEQTCLMFYHWRRVRDGMISLAVFRYFMAPIRTRIVALLGEAKACPVRKSAAMAAAILKLESALFTFVENPAVEPANNVSERKVRHGVMWRKSRFGTQSGAGSRFVGHILTADATLRQQNRNVLDFLADAVSAHFAHTAPPSLLPINA